MPERNVTGNPACTLHCSDPLFAGGSYIFLSESIDFGNPIDGHTPRAPLSLPRYQPGLIFMVEYYEKINRLILVFIEPCHECDALLRPVAAAQAL